MRSLALKAHNGRHVHADPSGELKVSSSMIGDSEKFELVNNEDGSISLRTCHGKYVSVSKGGDTSARETSVGDKEKFELTCHEDGWISLRSHCGYLAAETKCGLRANRQKAGAWEKFLPKDRSRQQRATPADDAGAGGGGQAAVAKPLPLFDACCQLQEVLSAEEHYSATRADKVAISFGKRARARRERGLEWSFRHFREEQGYTPAFRGCVSAWDATAVRIGDEADSSCLESSDGVTAHSVSRGRSASNAESEPCGSAGAERAWERILGEDSEDKGCTNGGPLVHAAFGIPAASAAEADDAAFERLGALCRRPGCLAVGPVGLWFHDAAAAAGAEAARDNHRGLSAARLVAKFGSRPGAGYDAKRDPACVAWLAAGGTKVEDWIVRHGDRRLHEFNGACSDYAQRRLTAQAEVAGRQVELAKELGLPLIVQVPPQEEAERGIAAILVERLGGPGCEHPILLSAFHGRPKCAGALLAHFPKLLVGFSGLLTHSKLKDSLGEVAFDVPLDRFVLESLGPRFPPAGVGDSRGSFSHPAHIVHAAAELAQVKGRQEAEVLEAAFSNALRLFRLPGAAAVPGTANAAAATSEAGPHDVAG